MITEVVELRSISKVTLYEYIILMRGPSFSLFLRRMSKLLSVKIPTSLIDEGIFMFFFTSCILLSANSTKIGGSSSSNFVLIRLFTVVILKDFEPRVSWMESELYIGPSCWDVLSLSEDLV